MNTWTFHRTSPGIPDVRCGGVIAFSISKCYLKRRRFVGDKIYWMICRGLGGHFKIGNGRGCVLERIGDVYWVQVSNVKYRLGDIESATSFITDLYHISRIEVPKLVMGNWEKGSVYNTVRSVGELRRRGRPGIPVNIALTMYDGWTVIGVAPGRIIFDGDPKFDIAVYISLDRLIVIRNWYNNIAMEWDGFVSCVQAFGLSEVDAYVLVGECRKI